MTLWTRSSDAHGVRPIEMPRAWGQTYRNALSHGMTEPFDFIFSAKIAFYEEVVSTWEKKDCLSKCDINVVIWADFFHRLLLGIYFLGKVFESIARGYCPIGHKNTRILCLIDQVDSIFPISRGLRHTSSMLNLGYHFRITNSWIQFLAMGEYLIDDNTFPYTQKDTLSNSLCT